MNDSDSPSAASLSTITSPNPQINPTSSPLKNFPITFNRKELDQILRIYGYKVAAGEWRDYAIDMLSDKAVFSVFRRTSEHPLYRIVKNPKLARKQGAYSVVAPTGLILKRGRELKNVLKIFEKKLELVSV